MKKIVYTLVLLASMLSAKAEYEKWLLKFTIEQTDGKKVTGYAFASPLEFEKDSINSTHYLINKLDQMDYKYDSAIRFSKNRIRYNYKQPGNEDQSHVYSLTTGVTIKSKNIRKITILEMLDTEYLAELRNNITFKDTTWLKTKVVKTVNTGGYLCGYALYFHEYNSELEKLLIALKKEAKKAEAKEDDSNMETILEKIMRFKVIVIASCTC